MDSETLLSIGAAEPKENNFCLPKYKKTRHPIHSDTDKKLHTARDKKRTKNKSYLTHNTFHITQNSI